MRSTHGTSGALALPNCSRSPGAAGPTATLCNVGGSVTGVPRSCRVPSFSANRRKRRKRRATHASLQRTLTRRSSTSQRRSPWTARTTSCIRTGQRVRGSASRWPTAHDLLVRVDCSVCSKVRPGSVGAGYASLSQYDKALEDAEKCVSLNPSWAKVRLNS